MTALIPTERAQKMTDDYSKIEVRLFGALLAVKTKYPKV